MYSTMDTYISDFINQLEEGIKIGEASIIRKPQADIHNIVVSGMGGSGIGGELAASMFMDELKLPMQVNHDYSLPSFVNENTLLIVCSYSGNTEETLTALNQGLESGASIICISSNGEVEKIAKKNQLDFIKIPGGIPPRAALNYSLVQYFFSLNKLNIISNEKIDQLKAAVEFLKEEENQIKLDAKSWALNLVNRFVVIYGVNRMSAVMARFQQQLNENSKQLAWFNTIPEMNHNELVGWTTERDDIAVVLISNFDDYYRNRSRMEIVEKIVTPFANGVFNLETKGKNFVEQCFYSILLADWISFEIARLRGVDPIEVRVIDYLKSELSTLE